MYQKNVGTCGATYVPHSVAPAVKQGPDGDLEILVSNPIGVFGIHRVTFGAAIGFNPPAVSSRVATVGRLAVVLVQAVVQHGDVRRAGGSAARTPRSPTPLVPPLKGANPLPKVGDPAVDRAPNRQDLLVPPAM